MGLVPAKASKLADGASPKNDTFQINTPAERSLPIDLTLSGIVTLAKPLQSKNAPLEIDVIPDEIEHSRPDPKFEP